MPGVYNQGLGKDINVGEYVIYFNGGDISNWITSPVKKRIWLVDATKGLSARVKNIDHTDKGTSEGFVANKSDLLSLEYISNDVLRNEKYVNPKSAQIFLNSQGYSYEPGLYKKQEYDRQAEAVKENLSAFAAGVRSATEKVNKSKTESKENKMNLKRQANVIVAQNSEAAREAALLVAGSTLNRVVLDKVTKQLPRKYRKLAQHPLANVVVANLASVAQMNFVAGNEKARIATDAMVKAAMVEVLSTFNIEQMVTDVLDNVNLNDFIPDTED